MRSIVVLLLLLNVTVFAQKKKKVEETLLREDAEWFEGSILLTDGTELQGLVKYNDNTGVLSFQDGADSKVFTSSRVAGFEFFDESLQKQRIFYTFEYEDARTSINRPLFFELVRDYKSFAILSRLEQLDLEEKAYTTYQPNGIGIPNNTNTRLVVSQTETIFLMSSDGEIMPYFKIVKKEDDNFFLGNDIKATNKMMDEDLLSQFVGESKYKKLEDYAKQNGLKFKQKDDFLKILEYYDTIRID
jgi:hypothetical protein